jgi:RNA polymerase sigma-70 factor, ECF subfamily
VSAASLPTASSVPGIPNIVLLKADIRGAMVTIPIMIVPQWKWTSDGGVLTRKSSATGVRRTTFEPTNTPNRLTARRSPREPAVTSAHPHDLTAFMVGGSPHDKATLDALPPAVYGELHALAERYLRIERPDHTLQPTALVHEAYIRLSAQRHVDWCDRAQFFGVAAQMMRRILVNHAEARNSAKRGGRVTRVTLDESVSWSGEQTLDLVELDEALTALSAFDPRQARVVELRFFAGLGIDETAAVMAISPATVKREWSVAKAWLRRELTRA